MIRRRNHDCVDVFVVDDLAEVVVLRVLVGELLLQHLLRAVEILVPQVAEGDRLHVVALQHEAEVGAAHAARADVARADDLVRA